jgi:hypothetical protein
MVIRSQEQHRDITRPTGQVLPITEVQVQAFHQEVTVHLQVREVTEVVRHQVQEITAVEVQVAEEAAVQLIRAVPAVHTRVGADPIQAAEVPVEVAEAVVLQAVAHHHQAADNFRIQI